MTSAPTRTMARNAPGIDRAYVRQVIRARSYRTVSTVIIVAGAAAAFALASTQDDVNTIFSVAASVFGVALALALAIEARGRRAQPHPHRSADAAGAVCPHIP